MKPYVTSLSLAVVTAVAIAGSAAADGVETIKQRGKLIVGVKADYKPFGYRDPTGAIVGIEPDLAADLAKRLGVSLEMIPVQSSNRIEFLQQGKIDVLLATMSDKPERRKSVQAIDPQYYSDFVNVLTNKKFQPKDWEEFRGKKLCATSGAWYNKEVERLYGPEIVAFDGSEKPLFALKQGSCVGYLYDQTFVQGRLLETEWSEQFHMPLKGVLPAPWIMAVALGNDSLKTSLEDATKDWMKTGFIVAEEKKYGIEPTEYSRAMHEKMKSGSN